MFITKEIQFDYGHIVHLHDSHCKHPHGHRARVVAHLEGDIVNSNNSDQGMVMDFKHIKTIMMNKIHNKLDHSFIISIDAPQLDYFNNMNKNNYSYKMRLVILNDVPTAENLALWCWNSIVNEIKDQYGTGLKLIAIEFWETPTSCAIYKN